MRFAMAEQYNRPCAVLDEHDRDPDEIIAQCWEAEATYVEDPDDSVCFVVQFPGRPMELYSESALRRSFKANPEGGK